MTCRHTLHILMAAVFVISAATSAIASADSAAQRFLERFETLCLMPVDDTTPALVSGNIAVQHVSARASEQGFLVNETLFNLADHATLTPFALYLASKGDGLTVMHDLRAVGAVVEGQHYFFCMFSSKDIAVTDLRAQLDTRDGIEQLPDNVIFYELNGETHRVNLDTNPDVGVTLLRQLPLQNPPETGADQ